MILRVLHHRFLNLALILAHDFHRGGGFAFPFFRSLLYFFSDFFEQFRVFGDERYDLLLFRFGNAFQFRLNEFDKKSLMPIKILSFIVMRLLYQKHRAWQTKSAEYSALRDFVQCFSTKTTSSGSKRVPEK